MYLRDTTFCFQRPVLPSFPFLCIARTAPQSDPHVSPHPTPPLTSPPPPPPPAMSKQPASLEDLLAQHQREQAATAKPVFLTKEQRAQLALERRQHQVQEQRQAHERERQVREEFFLQKNSSSSSSATTAGDRDRDNRDSRDNHRDRDRDNHGRDRDRDRDRDQGRGDQGRDRYRSRGGRDWDRDKDREDRRREKPSSTMAASSTTNASTAANASKEHLELQAIKVGRLIALSFALTLVPRVLLTHWPATRRVLPIACYLSTHPLLTLTAPISLIPSLSLFTHPLVTLPGQPAGEAQDPQDAREAVHLRLGRRRRYLPGP